jgi:anti-anti-sigma factor
MARLSHVWAIPIQQGECSPVEGDPVTMGEGMQIQQSTVQSAVVVRLQGRFEFGTRNEYKRLIGQIVQDGYRQLVLDLESVTFLDSSALGLLLLTDQNFKIKKGSFGLVKPTGYVRQVIELANLPRVIPVFESVEEALARLGAA